MNTRDILWVLGAGLALLGGCAVDGTQNGDDEDDVDDLESSVIIGDNDLVSVAGNGGNIPSRYRADLDAFGRLYNRGKGLCSATHVGGGVVVTAGHCFVASGTGAVRDRACDASIEWGYRRDHAVTRSQCTRLLAARYDGVADYAILRVSPVPAVFVPVAPARPADGTKLTIFSHPRGRPLEWSKTCSIKRSAGDHFNYDCDTEGGSSGAGVLSDGELELVGIHSGGAASGNGGTFATGTPLLELLDDAAPEEQATFEAVVSGKCIDVPRATHEVGRKLQQWSCNGTNAQKFALRDVGGGAYEIKNRASGLCFDIHGASRAAGAKLAQWTCSGRDNQAFRLDKVSGANAGYRLIAKHSDKCVAVTQGLRDNGATLEQVSCGSSSAQRFRLSSRP